jgi:hypothetical protein
MHRGGPVGKDRNRPSNCKDPMDFGLLADYWLAMLPAAEEKAVEKHLLGCDKCGTRFQEVFALADGIRKLACEESLRMIVSELFLKRAVENGESGSEQVIGEYTFHHTRTLPGPGEW